MAKGLRSLLLEPAWTKGPRPVETFDCPACGAEVTRAVPTELGAYFAPSPVEATALCARQHGTHDRLGRPVVRPGNQAAVTFEELAAQPPGTTWLPVVASSSASQDGGDAVFVIASPPPGFAFRRPAGADRYEVVRLGELVPSSLVGPLARVVAAGTVIGWIAADDLHLDGGGAAVDASSLASVVVEEPAP